MDNASYERRLESLLRGEIAAAETYNQLLNEIDDPAAAPLREVQGNHGNAIRFLYEQLDSRGTKPPTSSGMWGHFAKAVEGTAKFFGDKAALTALREGELQGLEGYESALSAGQIPADCQKTVSDEIIPAQRRHVEILDEMISTL